MNLTPETLLFGVWAERTRERERDSVGEVVWFQAVKMSATGGGEEDKKPVDQSAHINLKVKGQVLIQIFFSILRFGIDFL